MQPKDHVPVIEAHRPRSYSHASTGSAWHLLPSAGLPKDALLSFEFPLGIESRGDVLIKLLTWEQLLFLPLG